VTIDIPIVILTGPEDYDSPIRAASLNAVVLQTPCSADRLTTTIEQTVGGNLKERLW
jgi:DNA-binding NtrC family response regulator